MLAVFMAMYLFYAHAEDLETDMPHSAHEARTLIRETVSPSYQSVSRV